MDRRKQIMTTRRPGDTTRPGIRISAALILLGLLNTGVSTKFNIQDVCSVHRCSNSAGQRHQVSSYRRQNRTIETVATSEKKTARKRNATSLYHTQFTRSLTPAFISIRGGSTLQRKKNLPSDNATDEEKSKAIDDAQNDECLTTTSSSASSSSPLPSPSLSPSLSWTRRDLIVFLSSTFFAFLSGSLVSFAPAPALIAEIGSERATSTLSVIGACAALTEIIISPAMGSLLDSIGRKPALIFALSFVALVNGIAGVNSSVLTICAAKFVGMLCIGSFLTTSQVIVSDISVSNPEYMSSTLGVTYALIGCAFFVGAIGAGQLSEYGLSVTYATSTAVLALTAALIFFGMQETLHSSKRIPFKENKPLLQKQLLQSPWASCTRILCRHSKEVRILAILIMIQSLPSQMSDTFQVLVKTEWGIQTKDYSSFIAMFGIINIAANIVGSQMVLKLGIKNFTAIATLSSIIAPLGASLFSFRGLIIGAVLGFLASAQMLGVTAALYAEGAKSHVPQGELAGERSSFLALAKVIGPIWHSILYNKGKKVFGTGFLPFWFNISCGLVAFGISQRYLPS